MHNNFRKYTCMHRIMCVCTTFSNKETYFLIGFIIKIFLSMSCMRKNCKSNIIGLNAITGFS